MSDFTITARMKRESCLDASNAVEHGAQLRHRWLVECVRNGAVIWVEEYTNLVVTAGLNKYLDATLKTGLTTPAWYVGLIAGPGSGNTYASADTMASHAGWTEDAHYSNANRPTWTPGSISAGSVSNSGAVAVFNINGTATLAGCFMTDNSTVSGTSGTLLGEGNFSTGDRPLLTGDTLNVTVTCSLS